MAIISQVGRQPVQGGDRTMANFGASDIPAGAAVIFDQSNFNGVSVVATAGAITQTCGIAVDKIPAGKTGRICMHGSAVAVANETLAAGDAVMIDNSAGNEGKVILKTTGSRQLGIAMHAAAAGDPVEVQVNVATSL